MTKQASKESPVCATIPLKGTASSLQQSNTMSCDVSYVLGLSFPIQSALELSFAIAQVFSRKKIIHLFKQQFCRGNKFRHSF